MIDPTRQSYYGICKSNAAQCCINFGDFRGAIKYSTEALSVDRKNAKALHRRGVSHLKIYQGQRALDDFKAVLLLDPGNKEVAGQVEKVAVMHEEVLQTAMSGDMKEITRLLEIGADVNFSNSAGFSPLHVASQEGLLKVVELLLSKGASVHSKNRDGCIPKRTSKSRRIVTIERGKCQR